MAELLKVEKIAVADVYVPAKRRTTLDPKKVDEIAESMLASGQLTPIMVRVDGKRFVLVEGLHRLEACRALGETEIKGIFVRARQG
ncbi:MAG: chromosome partitioning protein ParB [Alphaproteobacteria bacterium]|nr:chromosome partitioning protein ParB [Alphaproteobacteria bacterium]